MSLVRTRSQDRIAQQAEILAVAQAQAQAEEEISGQLQREVLNIQRRINSQQLSMDKIHGKLSMLTKMVAQIGVTLGK
jgi:peptidoglycan hydrolase CwlO-like protein